MRGAFQAASGAHPLSQIGRELNPSELDSLCLAGMLTGKYSLEDPSSLPSGPRGLVFRWAPG